MFCKRRAMSVHLEELSLMGAYICRVLVGGSPCCKLQCLAATVHTCVFITVGASPTVQYCLRWYLNLVIASWC